MKINKEKLKEIVKRLRVDLRKLKIDTIIKGVKVELEHGTITPRTNVTNNDLEATLKIALAHFEESGPRYYELLEDLEEKLKPEWKGKTIFKK